MVSLKDTLIRIPKLIFLRNLEEYPFIFVALYHFLDEFYFVGMLDQFSPLSRLLLEASDQANCQRILVAD